MISSPLIAAIRQRLNEAGYDDLPTPFRMAGVEFQFTGALRGRHGRALDLVLLIDTTAGSFGDSDGARVRARVQALSRALDVTASRYVLTVVLAGATLPGDVEALADTARVLHVDTLPVDQAGSLDVNCLEDSLRVLLPLSIPQPGADEQGGTAQEQLEKALKNVVDGATIKTIMDAAERGDEAVTEAIASLIDAALVKKEEKA
ncbi:hypothetical protein KTQ54_09690 [Komagataeibacter oboediens]|uniref:hypothetical protein n=1 Tax=Komagataeibacter oboediens TaxID=65958 RepID=UPI001C2BBCC4|nr:hypothetical protein [Komagataeibacter oboediens]MBV0888808.1 hypothetical protein [Komagataeibacter oboediens]MCK9821546.1 hypothetical protein [Komagataeibacter oboediens]